MASRLRDIVRSHEADAREIPFLRDARSGRCVGRSVLAAAADTWSRELEARRVPTGGRVLIDVDDPLAFAVVYLSVMAAGRCSAPVDPSTPPAELRRSREALRPDLVVTDRPDRDGVLVQTGTGVPRDTHATPDPVPEHGPGSVVLLTSGSTGTPKAVELDESRLLHVARCVVRHHRLTPADRGFSPLPLFHVNAQVVALLATLVSGAELVLDRRFRRTGFWPVLVAHDVTWLNAVPAILTVLARDQDAPVVPERLRFVRSASAPLPEPVRAAIAERLGVTVVESYGMTEAASQITATPLDGPVRPGSVGRPVGVELEVVDDHGVPVRSGVVGRVRIRGAGVIEAYADGRGADRFDTHGRLDTGDLGRLDEDGFLHLAGRDDDVVNHGGELVYPGEVEEVLLGDHDVADAVLVGRGHDVLGEVPVAFVRPAVPTARPDVLADRLAARCVRQLARFKRPAEIRVVDELPVGPTGKVRRSVLRAGLDAVRSPVAS